MLILREEAVCYERGTPVHLLGEGTRNLDAHRLVQIPDGEVELLEPPGRRALLVVRLFSGGEARLKLT